MKIDNGILALLNPNIEYPLNQEPVSSLLSSADVESSETSRRRFLRGVLRKLDLDLPDNDTPAVGSRPLPQFLTCTPHHSTIVSKIVDTLSQSQLLSLTGENLKVLQDAEDKFHFHPFHSEESVKLLALSGHAETQDHGEISNWQPKHILVCDRMLPERQMTPLFNFELYFEALRRARERERLKDREEEDSWGIGEALLYGEVVTSTQTMLVK
jgi:biotin--protein ligase